MRITFLSLDFGLLFLVLVALLHSQETTALPKKGLNCPTNICVPSEQCEWLTFRKNCNNSENVCCELLKAEYRTECRHHGGECMDHCPELLSRRTTDCPANKKCCVLV